MEASDDVHLGPSVYDAGETGVGESHRRLDICVFIGVRRDVADVVGERASCAPTASASV